MTAAALQEAKRIAHKATTALGGCGIFGVVFGLSAVTKFGSAKFPLAHMIRVS